MQHLTEDRYANKKACQDFLRSIQMQCEMAEQNTLDQLQQGKDQTFVLRQLLQIKDAISQNYGNFFARQQLFGPDAIHAITLTVEFVQETRADLRTLLGNRHTQDIENALYCLRALSRDADIYADVLKNREYKATSN
ncbi:hypothetical protein COW95_01895 [Candidatus Peregrinibacteria bacterium CG22_combo_CG10-13_8_21_14_all_49_11]|nr:MAG: hypothetical protein COW95_01895 [Candidatus Peregrinibacteria bacterium CG22_combo_CG10-13_8_21_14_all_49_11]